MWDAMSADCRFDHHAEVTTEGITAEGMPPEIRLRVPIPPGVVSSLSGILLLGSSRLKMSRTPSSGRD
jgi:hypothetical protein